MSFIPEFGSCDFQNANISRLIGNYKLFINPTSMWIKFGDNILKETMHLPTFGDV